MESDTNIENLIKYGGFSLVIPNKIYSPYLSCNKDYLLKITYQNKFNNDEVTLLNNLENIEDYEKYFPKVKNEIILLSENNNNKFYYYLESANILTMYSNKNYDLYGYFIENCGNQELFDIISDINDLEHHAFCNNFQLKLYLFIEQMLNALQFLHNCKICHFDLKPENIMYNENYFSFSKRFKIIDFGFAEYYPFDHYVKNIKGTEPYIPKNEHKETPPDWYDIYNLNDWKIIRIRLI